MRKVFYSSVMAFCFLNAMEGRSSSEFESSSNWSDVSTEAEIIPHEDGKNDGTSLQKSSKYQKSKKHKKSHKTTESVDIIRTIETEAETIPHEGEKKDGGSFQKPSEPQKDKKSYKTRESFDAMKTVELPITMSVSTTPAWSESPLMGPLVFSALSLLGLMGYQKYYYNEHNMMRQYFYFQDGISSALSLAAAGGLFVASTDLAVRGAQRLYNAYEDKTGVIPAVMRFIGKSTCVTVEFLKYFGIPLCAYLVLDNLYSKKKNSCGNVYYGGYGGRYYLYNDGGYRRRCFGDVLSDILANLSRWQQKTVIKVSPGYRETLALAQKQMQEAHKEKEYNKSTLEKLESEIDCLKRKMKKLKTKNAPKIKKVFKEDIIDKEDKA